MSKIGFPKALYKRLRHDELLFALLLGVAIIIVGLVLGWENNKVIPINPASSAHYVLEPSNRLSFMSNWDGPIYLNLAKHGYTYKGLTNFFPLYPLLTRLVNTVVGSTLYSALLVSWVSFIGAIYFYFRIIKQLYRVADNFEAVRGVWFFVLFPTAVFLFATYTEGLFAFLALGAMYYALQKNYIASAAFAMFATATHVNGMFVVLFIALILLEEKEKIWKIVTTIIIGSLGLLSYMTFLQIKFHNAFSFISAQKNHSGLNFGVHHFLSEFATRNGIFLILLAITTIYWWSRRKSFALYSFLYFCIVFLGGRDLSGLGRYSLMAFPLEIMFYDYFRNKKFGYQIAFSLTAIAWAYFLLQYASGYTGG